MNVKTIIVGLLAITLDGCYTDVESVLYPETNCTPGTRSQYTADVIPILNTYCNSCHSGTFASGGIRLDGYNYVKIYVDNGKLMGSINWEGGFSPMPKDAGKLSLCNIDKIKTWIDAGAIND